MDETKSRGRKHRSTRVRKREYLLKRAVEWEKEIFLSEEGRKIINKVECNVFVVVVVVGCFCDRHEIRTVAMRERERGNTNRNAKENAGKCVQKPEKQN